MPVRILVAEDDAEIAALLQMALEDEGYAVHVVSEPEMAIQQLRDNRFALLISDQLSGAPNILSAEVRQWVHQVATSQPTVLLTARDWAAHISDEERATLAQNLGVAAIVPKPFDVTALLDLVGRLVDAQQE
jgi:DNA-binding response OmpR family regulator